MTNLGKVLTAHQKLNDVENRDMAEQIGIGESTLSRVKAGDMPNADGFLKIMSWLVRPHGG